MADAAATGNVTRRRSSPAFLAFIGVLALGLFVVATLLRIQASESFILNGATVSFIPDWSIIMQVPNLFTTHVSSEVAKSTVFGWGIEVIYLICVAGYEAAHEGIAHMNKNLAGWFRTGAILILMFDSWTDFSYGSFSSGFMGQLEFAAVTAFLTSFAGIAGWRILEHAFIEWSR